MSMLFRLIVILASVTAVSAFSAPLPSAATRSRLVVHSRAVGVAPRSSAVAVASPPLQDREPDLIAEGIYKFNKFLIDTVYDIICFLYPVKGTDRDFARFYVLETVARVPYFAYLSVMHLRETFGDRDPGDKERMRTHYAEADNEYHHLLIMEALGGNSSAIDRTLAQTMAFAYYWYVVGVYMWSPQAAYHLSELIEDHAYNTYDGYLNNHAEKLKKMEVPQIARDYYEKEDPFMFDLFCTVKEPGEQGRFSDRRPKLESLYDVFTNVRNDEKEHWKTLCNLVQYDNTEGTGGYVKGTTPLVLEPSD
mmetsp:Transcript_1215/g.3377  ORF Transcript_1215/g.3377 Transcript_1215/m.3377 type:complete len:307 (+) Transcript_1215:60-980(+)